MKEAPKPRTLQLLDRAAALMAIVAKSESPLSLRDIALRAELAPSTVHRLLWSLHEKGWLKPIEHNRWTLGDEILALGQLARARLAFPMPDSAMLQDLKAKIDAKIFLCVRHGDTLLPLETECLKPMPLHANSAGCILLSQLGSNDLAGYFGRHPEAASQRESLFSTVEHAREFGWLQSTNDIPGKTLVCVPVVDTKGAVRASLNLLFEAEGQIAPEELSALLTTADSIGKSL